MKYKFAPLIPLVIGAVLLPLTSQAQLRITEVQSSSDTPDWFELTNLGSNPVDITGYAMDDSSKDSSLSVALLGVTSINSGESVVFFEVSGTSTFSTLDFQNWWGVGSSIQIGNYIGTGKGVSFGSGSSGDGVNIFTSTGANGTLVDSVSFGSATKGTTFGWNGTTTPSTFLGLSAAGVDGAFMGPSGDIGSPGVAIVPEPSVLGLFGLAVGGLFLRRTLKRA